MSNILITGVAGLLGSRLGDYLKNTNHKIFGIDDLSGGYIENVDKDITFYKIDLGKEKEKVSSLFEKHKFDYVYHFAAYAAEGLSPFIRNYNYINNLIATTNIVNECIKHSVKRLVFTSTMAVYGSKYSPPFTEDLIPSPIDPYGIAKAACEADIRVAGEQHGLDWCIIRPHNVYGIKQNIWDKYRNVLGIWMYQRLNSLPLTIYGDGQQTRAFSYIDDCLPCLAEASTSPVYSKEIFNLGGDEYISIKDACDLIIKVTGGGEKVFLEKRHEARDAWVCHNKIKRVTGFQHKTTLEEGLSKMWEWAKLQPSRSRFTWPSYELDKNIYSFWKVN